MCSTDMLRPGAGFRFAEAAFKDPKAALKLHDPTRNPLDRWEQRRQMMEGDDMRSSADRANEAERNRVRQFYASNRTTALTRLPNTLLGGG